MPPESRRGKEPQADVKLWRALRAGTPECDAFIEGLHARGGEADAEIRTRVTEILGEVQKRGDQALLEYTARFDKLKVKSAAELRVTAQEIATARVSPEVEAALKLAVERIRSYHERAKPGGLDYTDAQGVRLGARWTPMDAAGIYVPGGTAAYPSSVLMNAIPAQVAGVERLVMAVPAPEGKIVPAVLVAARLAGVSEIWRIGGAQAIAALAFGTETITPVAMIAGPGNAYVAEAKRQVYGRVGIDSIAGPSEIAVLADGKNNPRWIAADLLSQAEHDTLASSVLITDNEIFAATVAREITEILKTLPRADIATASLRDYGAVIFVKDLAREGAEIVNRLAPEHLELAVEEPESLLSVIRHAGAIFLGRHTPEAVGDYLAGPSHVLPTAGGAAFSSGLSVRDFMKRSSLIGCSAKALAALGGAVETLADAEGLQAHKLSVSVRRDV